MRSRYSAIGSTDVDLSTLATEETLSNVKDAIDILEVTLNNIESNTDKLDVDLSTRASESTLSEIKDSIGQESGTTILSRLQEIYNKLDVQLSSRASELTLSNVKTNLDDVKTKLDTLNTKDFATQTTLSQIKTAIDAINTDIDVVLSTRASEATLTEIKEILGQESGVTVLSRLQELLDQLDVDLSTRASENTLIQVRDYLDTVETKLQSLIDKNQAKETGGNLDNIKSNTDKLDTNLSTRLAETTFTGRIGEVQTTPTQYTLLGRLKDLWDKLNDLFTNGLAKIKLWDGTNTVQVDTTGRVVISTQSLIPIGTTEVSNIYYSSMAGTVDSFYVIPNGVTLRLTKFAAGAEDPASGNVIELYYALNGTTVGIQIIDAIFSSGNSNQHDLNKSYIGNGTRAILLRRRRLSGGAKEIFGKWEGYY